MTWRYDWAIMLLIGVVCGTMVTIAISLRYCVNRVFRPNNNL